MKLFYVPGTCSLSPHIVLREMGAEFALDKVDRHTKVAASGVNYNQLNPKSYVPGLPLDDGTLLTEGAAIVMYLADQNGGEKVSPKAGTKERYKMQEWLVFISSELHKNFGALFRKSPDPVPRESPRVEIQLPQPLQEFVQRVKARPAVAKALEVEGLT